MVDVLPESAAGVPVSQETVRVSGDQQVGVFWCEVKWARWDWGETSVCITVLLLFLKSIPICQSLPFWCAWYPVDHYKSRFFILSSKRELESRTFYDQP